MLRRISAAGLVSVLALGVSAPAQTPVVTSDAAFDLERSGTAAARRRRLSAAARLLSKRVDEIDWVDRPFEEVVNWLRAEGEDEVNVVTRWNALNIEGIDRDTLVTLQLHGVTVGDVLFEVMSLISEGDEARFMAYENVIKISTRADFNSKMYLRVYDATDVVFRVNDFGDEAPNIDLQQTARAGGGGGGGGGQSVFQGAGGSGGQSQGGEQAEQEMEERLEELREVIEQTIAPDSWDTATGRGGVAGQGRIRVYNRSLVVYNTIDVHEMIAGYFSFDE